jgi:hypothetical protein
LWCSWAENRCCVKQKIPFFPLSASFALCDFRPSCAITIYISRLSVHRHDPQCCGKTIPHTVDLKRSLKPMVIWWTATTAPCSFDQVLTLLTELPRELFEIDLPAERLCDTTYQNLQTASRPHCDYASAKLTADH